MHTYNTVFAILINVFLFLVFPVTPWPVLPESYKGFSPSLTQKSTAIRNESKCKDGATAGKCVCGREGRNTGDPELEPEPPGEPVLPRLSRLGVLVGRAGRPGRGSRLAAVRWEQASCGIPIRWQRTVGRARCLWERMTAPPDHQPDAPAAVRKGKLRSRTCGRATAAATAWEGRSPEGVVLPSDARRRWGTWLVS